jgi:hypothetical protein
LPGVCRNPFQRLFQRVGHFKNEKSVGRVSVVLATLIDHPDEAVFCRLSSGTIGYSLPVSSDAKYPVLLMQTAKPFGRADCFFMSSPEAAI